MRTGGDPNHAGDCPGRDELAAFQAGRLDEGRLGAVAGHLAACAGCLRTLEGLPDVETVVSRLRRFLPRPALSLDPECEYLAAVARAIAPEAAGGTTAALDSGATPPAPGAAAGRPPAVKEFGGYQLLQKIGHGGMGVVWKARQVRLNRLVALKMIRFSHAADPHAQERFRVEGEAVARLAHPNVVEVYDSGEHDGQPYFSMELLEGGSLARRVAGGPLPPREAAELVRTLARAVQAAHDRRIVHRDLKPANVLFATDGTAKITDFGLAKLLDAEAGQTQTGDVLGTPSYMAPEQARGDAAAVGPAADVYALGAILYECLTGRPPFKGATRAATLEQVRTQAPSPLAGAAPDAAGLEAVCRKCLEKAPARRYASAAALADDLTRWLDGQPTAARRRPRGVGRRAVLGAALGAGGLGAAAALGFFWWKRADPLDEAYRALERGEPAVLVGDAGGPPWRAWVLDGRGAGDGREPDGAFSVHAFDAALLELLPRVPIDRYRLCATLRHLRSGEEGEVGLFVGRKGYATAEGAVYLFVRLAFNDVVSAADYVQALNRRLPPDAALPVPAGNMLALKANLYGREKTTSPGDNLTTLAHEDCIQPGRFARPAGRDVVLEVTPERLRVFWDGGVAPALDVPARQVQVALAGHLAALGPKHPELAGVDPAFDPRGGLGLAVTDGAAIVRSVRVEPLTVSP
jgi:serine/threonine-protein kinase